MRATTDVSLKQGAKRAVLSDVSNRPIAVLKQTGLKHVAQVATRKTSLARPARREVLHVVPIPVATETIEEESDLSDEGDMDVDNEQFAHAILPGASIVNPVYTKGDTAELQRVVDVFVDEWDEWNDVSMVQEYADDIFTYMHKLEVCSKYD